MKISEHISYEEAIKSQTGIRLGIKNIPNEFELEAMKLVAENCFEPIKKHFEIPLIVNSFFRCSELNKAIGGAKTSQHCKGEAIDIDSNSREINKKIFEWAKANLIFDQLISENVDSNGECEWVHVSFRARENRNQSLYMKKINGISKYFNEY